MENQSNTNESSSSTQNFSMNQALLVTSTGVVGGILGYLWYRGAFSEVPRYARDHPIRMLTTGVIFLGLGGTVYMLNKK